MKKLITKITFISALSVLAIMPSTALAQEEVIDIENEETTTLPVTGAPDTGIAPSNNAVVQNTAVFIGGSLLGAGIGLGILKLRKNSSEK